MKNLQSILVCVLLLITAQQGIGQKVVQWRGDHRDGIYNENKLMKAWPEKGPSLLWFTEMVGSGFAAPVITGDKVFINGEADSTSYLFAFDLKGKLLWKSPNGKEYYGQGFSATYPGSRSTPTVVGDLVYATSGHGRLACFDVASGKEKWAVGMVSDLGGIENEFGYSESPLIDGDNLFCTPGGAKNNVVAINRLTGKTTWTSKALSDTTSFCSPIMISLPGRKIFVNISRHFIYGLDAKSGELLWSQKLENFKYEGEHCSTPLYADGFLYYMVEDENGNGAVKLEISPDGKNIKEIWRNRNATNAMGGYLKIGNHLFTTTKKKKLICIDAIKGNIVDSLSSTKGSLIYADNLIYCYNETGVMKLIRFENNKFTEISKFRVEKGTKEHFSHPVIANGTMYIRHGKALIAYDIKEK
jgi:outer membrane protein assembly factor BamB